MVALTHVFFGYMVISLLTILRRIDDTLYDAAANLGASRFACSSRSAAAQPAGDHGGLDAGLRAQRRAYATPALVGGSRMTMLGVEVYNLAIQQLAWGDAAAVRPCCSS